MRRWRTCTCEHAGVGVSMHVCVSMDAYVHARLEGLYEALEDLPGKWSHGARGW